MITVGSISRERASEIFPFLAKKYKGRRKAIHEFTHLAPDFVFWIYPDGKLHDARDSHGDNPPPGHEHILDDEPEYGGFLRGRVASNYGPQLIAVYCREDALAYDQDKINQFVVGMRQLPIPVQEDALVISDNADIYGTLQDLIDRSKVDSPKWSG